MNKILLFHHEQSTFKFTREFILLSGSTLFYQISRLLVSLIVANQVDPEEFGVWNILSAALLYAPVITLGVANGMNRDVPFRIGEGCRTTANKISDSVFWFILTTNIIASMFIFLVSLAFHHSIPSIVFATGVLLTAWQTYQYFLFRNKCYFQFQNMSFQQAIFAVTLPIFAIPLTSVFGISGFIIGQATSAFLACLLIVGLDSTKITLYIGWSELKPLIRIGFPIMFAGILYNLFTSIDRWIIVNFLGLEYVGQYTIVILCFGALSVVSDVISQQIYPRMAFLFGKTRDKRSLLSLVIWQSLLGTLVSTPVMTIVYMILPLLVEQYMPAYRDGIEPARIILIGLGFRPLSGGFENFLNTVGKHNYYLAILLIALSLNVCLDIFFVKQGFHLKGVALGASLSYVIYTIILVVVSLWMLSKK